MSPKKLRALCVLIGWFIPLAVLGGGLHLASAQPRTAYPAKEPPPVVTVPDPGEEVELIGHIGGDASAIDVNGKYIAVTYKGGFELVSIANPAHPRDLGFLAFPSYFVHDIALDGDYAYITYGWSDGFGNDVGGLYIIDISDPTAPVLVRDIHTDIIHRQVAIDGQYAYVTLGYNPSLIGLKVFDVSNPSAPVAVGYLEGEVWFDDIEIFQEKDPGNHVYAYLEDPLSIVDLTDPAQPETIGNYFPISNTNIVDVAVYSQYYDQTGNIYLYLAESAYDSYQTGGIEIVDATYPFSPARLMTYDPGTNYRNIEINGSYAYAGSDQGLHILDISDPTAPLEIFTYTVTQNIFDIAVWGKYLYFADPLKGLHILDISAPSNPIVVAVQNDVIENVPLVAGNYAYAFGNPGEQGMQIWDVLNPVAPIQVGTLSMPPCCLAAVQSGNYALLADGERHVRLLDISEPVLPVEASSMEIDHPVSSFGGATGIAVKGTIASPEESAFAYITSFDGMFLFQGYVDIFDISDPSVPLKRGQYIIPGRLLDISISDQYAFILNTEYGYLGVLDISAIEPTLVTTTTIDGSYLSDMDILGSYAYIATGDGLSTVDLSDPASPLEVGRYEYIDDYGLDQLVVREGFAYLTDSGISLLVVLDISDPAHPREVERLQMPGWGDNLVLFGDVIYASNGEGGISIFQHALDTGKVKDVNGRPFSGVTVAVDDQTAAASGLTGSYDVGDSPPGTHTLSPGLQDYAFRPPGRTVELTELTQGQDFTALPEPVSITLSTSLTTTLRYTDTSYLLTRLDFPPVPLPGTLTLVLTPTLYAGFADQISTGHAFELRLYQDGSPLPGFSFPSPVRASIQYSRLNVRFVDVQSEPGFYWWDGSAWIDGTATCSPPTGIFHHPHDRMVEASFCQAGIYALLGPTNLKYLSLIHR